MEAALSPRARRVALHALGAVGAGLVLHVLAAVLTDTAPDEAYYAAWSRHLGPAYLDHPPAVAWVIAAGRALAGEGSLGVRLPALLAGALVPLLLGFAAARLAAARGLGPAAAGRLDAATAARVEPAAAAVVALWLTSATLLLHVLGVVVTPDTPLTVAWAFGLAVAADLWVRPARPGAHLLLLGVASGLAGLSKLTGWALLLGLVAAILWTPRVRRAVGLRLFYVPAVALAVAAPWVRATLADPAASDLGFQLARLTPRGFPGRYVPELIGGQLGLLGPVLGVLLVAWLWRAAHRRDERDRLLLALSVPLLGGFLAIAFLRPVEANWPGPAWMAALVGLAVAGVGARERRLVLVTAVPLVLALHVLAVTGIPFVPKDPTARLRGWSELGGRLAGPCARSTAADSEADAGPYAGPYAGAHSAAGAAVLAADGYDLAAEVLQYAPACAPVRLLPGGRPTQLDRWPAPPIGTGTLILHRSGRAPSLPPGCVATGAVQRLAAGPRTLLLFRLRCGH